MNEVNDSVASPTIHFENDNLFGPMGLLLLGLVY